MFSLFLQESPVIACFHLPVKGERTVHQNRINWKCISPLAVTFRFESFCNPGVTAGGRGGRCSPLGTWPASLWFAPASCVETVWVTKQPLCHPHYLDQSEPNRAGKTNWKVPATCFFNMQAFSKYLSTSAMKQRLLLGLKSVWEACTF